MVKLKLQLFAKKVTDSIVQAVIRGNYGNGQARKTALANAGYDYNEVQSAVNAALKGNSSGTSTNTSKANNNSPVTKKINGVEDQALQDKAFNNTFNESDYADVMAQKDKLNSSISKLEGITSVEDIIDQSTMDALNQRFEVSDAYNQAMAYTNQLLEKLSTGRTSYTDQINDMMNKIQNRDEFEYDVDKDQLFQQALASAMGSGKTAMQDTIGQASALTGGYGSTYATSAGNQAYNSFIEDAYNNLPEYYQMAMEAYQMEGQEMYNQLGMLQAADESEWNKLYTSWDSNFKTAQNIWNQDFSTWEAGVNQAYNSAQLQLSEYNTELDAAFKMYSANMDMYSTMYSNAWNNWDSAVKQAQAAVSAYQTDYWSQKDLDYKNASLDEQKRQFNLSIGDVNNDGRVTAEEKSANTKLKEATSSQKQQALEAYNTGGTAAMNKYINSIPDSYDKDSIAKYVGEYGEDWVSDWEDFSSYAISKDTFNWFWGDDNNDEYSKKNADGSFNTEETLTYSDLKKKINDSNIPKDKKEELLKQLKGQQN